MLARCNAPEYLNKLGIYISVRCTSCIHWIIFSTNINGALQLKMTSIFYQYQKHYRTDF